jgi:hypothetical protein
MAEMGVFAEKVRCGALAHLEEMGVLQVGTTRQEIQADNPRPGVSSKGTDCERLIKAEEFCRYKA